MVHLTVVLGGGCGSGSDVCAAVGSRSLASTLIELAWEMVKVYGSGD